MIDKIQAIFRAFFRAIVIAMLIFNYDNKQIWAFPFGLLIGMLGEIEILTKK